MTVAVWPREKQVKLVALQAFGRSHKKKSCHLRTIFQLIHFQTKKGQQLQLEKLPSNTGLAGLFLLFGEEELHPNWRSNQLCPKTGEVEPVLTYDFSNFTTGDGPVSTFSVSFLVSTVHTACIQQLRSLHALAPFAVPKECPGALRFVLSA